MGLNMKSYANDVEATEGLKSLYSQLKTEVSKVIVGQNDVVDKILISNCNMKDTVFTGLVMKSSRIQDTYLDN